MNQIKVRIFVKEKDSEYVDWENISQEKKKELGMLLNDNALRATGYEPVNYTSDKTA